MGEFRKYRPYYACNALRFNGNETVWYYSSSSSDRSNAMTRVPNFQDIYGTEYGWLLNMFSRWTNSQYSNNTTIDGTSYCCGTIMSSNYQHFVYLTPFATADVLANYNVDDYEINSIGTCHNIRAQFVAEDVNKILYSMSIMNDNTDTYEANTSITWASDTYYELVDESYVLVETMPEDWDTTYMNYYVLHEAEDITISCIKFRKIMGASSNSSRSYDSATLTESNQVGVYALYVAYFLDEAVTIQPGESYLLSLSFESSQF